MYERYRGDAEPLGSLDHPVIAVRVVLISHHVATDLLGRLLNCGLRRRTPGPSRYRRLFHHDRLWLWFWPPRAYSFDCRLLDFRLGLRIRRPAEPASVVAIGACAGIRRGLWDCRLDDGRLWHGWGNWLRNVRIVAIADLISCLRLLRHLLLDGYVGLRSSERNPTPLGRRVCCRRLVRIISDDVIAREARHPAPIGLVTCASISRRVSDDSAGPVDPRSRV